MNNIDSARSKFFPKSKIENESRKKAIKGTNPLLKGNDLKRQKQIENKTARDAKVSIPESVKDFAKIRKAVDAAPEIDNSAKIAKLKQQIKSGTYSINYDALADKMLENEF